VLSVTESTGDSVDVIEWRRQREALLDRLYILETESGGRARSERVVAENILRLKERLAELDAKLDRDASSA
jgi:hypothetical protein